MITIKKDVTSYFLAEDTNTDFNAFTPLAMDVLSPFNYAGVGVGNDYTQCEFMFNTTDEEGATAALDALLSSYTSAGLATLKLEVCKKINVYRNGWMADYFPYDNKAWNCDEESRINILGMILKAVITAILVPGAGFALAPDEIFRDVANENVPVTGEYMAYLGQAWFDFRKQCYVASWIHKYWIGIQTNAEDVIAYDYTVGWPSKDPA